jgi:hypothetical protein
VPPSSGADLATLDVLNLLEFGAILSLNLAVVNRCGVLSECMLIAL